MISLVIEKGQNSSDRLDTERLSLNVKSVLFWQDFNREFQCRRRFAKKRKNGEKKTINTLAMQAN